MIDWIVKPKLKCGLEKWYNGKTQRPVESYSIGLVSGESLLHSYDYETAKLEHPRTLPIRPEKGCDPDTQAIKISCFPFYGKIYFRFFVHPFILSNLPFFHKSTPCPIQRTFGETKFPHFQKKRVQRGFYFYSQSRFNPALNEAGFQYPSCWIIKNIILRFYKRCRMLKIKCCWMNVEF